MSEDKLTPMQALFVLEYMKDLNATQACLRAGYCKDNPDNADKVGPELLGKTRVAEEIQKAMDDRANRLMITDDLILSEIKKLATVDLSLAYDEKGKLLHPKDMPEDLRKAIASIEIFEEFEGRGNDREYVGDTVKVKFYDKGKMLELLGKHKVLFAEKHIHEGKVTLEDLVLGSMKDEEKK